MLQNVIGYISKIYKATLILLTSIMFVVVGANVFSRFVLNRSLGWADELARFIFIWISLLGAVLAYHENRHIGLDFIIKKITNTKVQSFIIFLGNLLVLIVLAFLTYFGLRVANSARNVSPALYIPMRTVYMILPISALLMIFVNLSKTIISLKIFLGISDAESSMEKLIKDEEF